MKKMFSLFLLGGFFVISYAQTSKKDEDVIRIANSFFNSWNKHDFSDMESYSTDDISCVIDAGLLWKGRNQVQTFHENAHKTLMKNTSFTPDQQTISTRSVTPDVVVVNLIAKMDAYYPPDGVNRGNNKAGDTRIMITLIEAKKNGKWLLTSIQGTDINPQVEAALAH
jgi:uncharacterized protein (TIGR02246 family)